MCGKNGVRQDLMELSVVILLFIAGIQIYVHVRYIINDT